MNLFVGNLSWDMDDEELMRIFSVYGTVSSARVMRDKFNNRSKGFGFVDMPNDTEAQAAMSSLNGASVMGRNITVNEARPKTDRPANKGFRKKSW